MKKEQTKLGEEGENIATQHLISNNFKILERNWRFGHKEIDIIAEKAGVLVIVEVKTRSHLEFEDPREAVTLSKQRKIIAAADAYLQQNERDCETRFDIVSVLALNGNWTVEHIEDAFYPLVR